MMKKMNLRLLIVNVRGSVKRVIELTKLTEYFPIADTIEDAIHTMAGV
jgi:anti-sigma B factor antagonist